MRTLINVRASEDWVRSRLSGILTESERGDRTPLEGFVGSNDFVLVQPRAVLGYDAVECRGHFQTRDGVTLLEAQAEFHAFPLLPAVSLISASLTAAAAFSWATQLHQSHPVLTLAGLALVAFPLIQALRVGTELSRRVRSSLREHAA